VKNLCDIYPVAMSHISIFKSQPETEVREYEGTTLLLHKATNYVNARAFVKQYNAGWAQQNKCDTRELRYLIRDMKAAGNKEACYTFDWLEEHDQINADQLQFVCDSQKSDDEKKDINMNYPDKIKVAYIMRQVGPTNQHGQLWVHPMFIIPLAIRMNKKFGMFIRGKLLTDKRCRGHFVGNINLSDVSKMDKIAELSRLDHKLSLLLGLYTRIKTHTRVDPIETKCNCVCVCEKDAQLRLSQSIPDSKREVVCNAGIVDVLTDTEVIEVKHVDRARNAIGQVLMYAKCFPFRKKRIHIFGVGTISPYLLDVCKDVDIAISTCTH
jgi:hypothetical protein